MAAAESRVKIEERSTSESDARLRRDRSWTTSTLIYQYDIYDVSTSFFFHIRNIGCVFFVGTYRLTLVHFNLCVQGYLC
jgi:hypothetical protein